MRKSRTKLILHFDINKTILMSDQASGKDSEEALISDIIAGMSWGKVEQIETNGIVRNEWRCTSDLLSITPPHENLVTYR